MSEQFFYVHLKFTQEIVVEVPRGLLNQRQSDLVGKGFTEKALALGLYDEDPPVWYEHRHRVMNKKPCDHEESGIRAWKIA